MPLVSIWLPGQGTYGLESEGVGHPMTVPNSIYALGLGSTRVLVFKTLLTLT